MAITDLTELQSSTTVKIVGSDATGNETTPVKSDAGGSLQVAGEGVAGTPAGGVVSVQGVAGGTAMPVSLSSAVTDLTASGTITANGQTVVLATGAGQSEWALELSGTFSAGSTVTWEVTLDGTNWHAVNGRQTGIVNTVLVNTISGGSGPYLFRGNLAGSLQFRVRCTAFQAADSISVTIRASTGVGAVFLNASIPAGANTIGSVKLTDGTNTAAISPNSEERVTDSINISGVNAAISCTTSAAEAKVSSSRLVNRKVLTLCPTNGIIYWGYTNAVTVSSGTPIFKNQLQTFNFTDNVPIYIIAASTVDVRVTEAK